jgi:hypothetical protein
VAVEARGEAPVNAPEEEQPTPLWLLLLVLVGIVAAAIGLYFAAKVFPPHPKTLARAAVVIGFVGAAILVEQLAREVIKQFRRIVVIAITVGPPVAALILSSETVLVIIGAFVAVGALVPLFVSPESDIASKLSSIDSNSKLGRYGPIVLGMALLVLGVFLQLRSIEFSRD